jgi:fluoride ion exporter CrcB/FEX
MGQTEIVIALGGALGVVLRYSSSLFFSLHLPNKPYISNIAGECIWLVINRTILLPKRTF